jgi:hypothetical protein
MAIQGMNLPSIAGVLGFKDFTNQLNNANAGVKNAVGLVNDWAKMAAQQNNAEKAAQAQRDFTAEQNKLNRDFQQAQQNERFEHELGMFEKQQERQLQNEARKARYSIEEAITTPISDKYDTNAMTEQKLRNKVSEIKEHPEWFGSDEEYNDAIAGMTRRANEVMLANKDIKSSNKLTEEFKEFDKGDWRNKQSMYDWFMENQDEIDRLHPEMRRKVETILERKNAEKLDYDREQRGKRRGETRDALATNKALNAQSADDFVSSLH